MGVPAFGIALFGFQLRAALPNGGVRGRVHRISRSTRPVAFGMEVTANVAGIALFAIVIAWLTFGA